MSFKKVKFKKCNPCVRYEPQKNWSGRQDSNQRPSRWQRDALPTELRPRKILTHTTVFFFKMSNRDKGHLLDIFYQS